MIEKGAPVDVEAPLGPLPLAVQNNHGAVAELLIMHSPDLIHKRVDVSVISPMHTTALHTAATFGSPPMIDMLIRAGADKDMENTYRPIHAVVVNGNFTAVRLLLAFGAEPVYDDLESHWVLLPLAAGHGYTRCVEALLEDKRIDIEAIDSNYRRDGTALFVAVDKGHSGTCALLLDKGADPDNPQNPCPVLLKAVAKGDLEAVKLLIERSNPSAENRNKSLHSAVGQNPNLEIVNYLVQNGADCNGLNLGKRPIHEAVLCGHREMVDALVKAGADADALEDEGTTPLHLAYNNEDMTRTLIKLGCNVNIARQTDGSTALHLAIDNLEVEVAKAIINEGKPKLELKTSSSHQWPGFTPLALAAWHDNAEITKLLLEAGADPNSKTEREGCVVLHLSPEDEVVRTLLDFEPNLTLQNENGDTPLNKVLEYDSVTVAVVKRLLRQGSDINQPNKDGETPLFKTISKTSTDIAELLLSRGADLKHVSLMEGTILHAACCGGTLQAFNFFLEKIGFTDKVYPNAGTLVNAACMRDCGEETSTLSILNTLRGSDGWNEIHLNQVCGMYGSALGAACYCNTEKVVTWLLSNNVARDIRDVSGRYPIHFAAYRNVSIFGLLYRSGFDISVRDNVGRTVLHMAVQSGSCDLIQFILKQDRSFLTIRDHDGWMPLHYALRGVENYDKEEESDPQQEIVQLLISELDDAELQDFCESDFTIFGHEDENWSVLRFARFHNATMKSRRILRTIMRKQSDEEWDQEVHETRVALNLGFGCDHCFAVCIILKSGLVISESLLTSTFT